MSANISAEDIKKIVSGTTTESTLGAYGGHSPLLDLVTRLSGNLNQQTAESNLYRGGAGYGGSFMNADQVAARNAGKKLNAKPYGGWGGYGSENATMTNKIPIFGNDHPSYIPTGGNGTPGGGGTDTATGPHSTPWGGQDIPLGEGDPVQPGTHPGGGTGVPYTGEQPTSTVNNDPYASFAGDGGKTPTTWGGNLKPGDPGWNPAWEGGGPSGGFGQGNPNVPTSYVPPANLVKPGAASSATATTIPGLQQYGDPNVQQIYESLVAGGMRPDAAMDYDSIRGMIAQGASPGLVLKNLQAVMAKVGPNAFSQMHGQLGAMNGSVEDLTNGKWVQGTLANAGIDPGEVGPIGKLDDPMPAPVKPTTPPRANPNANANQKANNNNNGGGPPDNPNNPTVPPGSSGLDVNGKPYKNPYPLPKTSTGMTSQGLGDQNPAWLDPEGAGFNPQGGDVIASGFTPGKDWGSQPTPPKNMQIGDVFVLPDGTKQVMVAPGKYSNWYVNDQGTPTFGYMKDGLNGEFLNAPGEGMKPIVGGKQVIGYDENGNPIYNDNGMFEQGDNASGVGDTTPDAWSNSPDWRPEEPTGGVYGSYTEMASGKMTDYENAIGEGWRNMNDNPVTAEDADYAKLVADYNKTPGKGIDEAYNTYNGMINGGGYSADEKGAIEGSAVRGVSNGYQRSADEIRRQGARTNNRASAYAALSDSGAKYGADLGEINRQNQLKFADEAERRKEAGASGMTNVAGLAQTKASFGIGAAGDYAKEIQRRREAAKKGMTDYATFGRGIQSQGVAGLKDMLDKSNADKNNTYAQIAAILGTNVGQSSTGTSETSSHGSGFGFQI